MKTINAKRVERFEQRLRIYKTDATIECRLIDLLTDARHWCDRNGLRYTEHDCIAQEHHSAELVEAAAGPIAPASKTLPRWIPESIDARRPTSERAQLTSP